MDLSAAQIIYSCMQTADIFTLGAKITELGMDQRKVNMLAREVGPQLGFWKPVVVSHHMLMGLSKPLQTNENMTAADRAIQRKMSKSNPDSAIFMTDTREDITRKINKAYCPEGQITDNPILEYCKYILFELYPSMTVERPEKWGGNLTFSSYTQLEKVYQDKQLHPQDLKWAVVTLLDQSLQPVRKHFEDDAHAKELLAKVKSFQVTK